MNSNDELVKMVKEMLSDSIQTHMKYIRNELERFNREFDKLFKKQDEMFTQIAQLSSVKNNHEKRIGKLESKSRLNTFISGIFGFLGGIFWQATKKFWN